MKTLLFSSVLSGTNYLAKANEEIAPYSAGLFSDIQNPAGGSWINVNLTVASQVGTGLDGKNTAHSLMATATGSVSFVQAATLNDTACTAVFFVKPGNVATQLFILRNVTTATNLVSQTITWANGPVSGIGYSATPLWLGWWRVKLFASTGITSGDTMRAFALSGSWTEGDHFFFWYGNMVAGIV